MTRTLLTLFALLALLLPALSWADDKRDATQLSEDEQAVLDLTNAERKKADLPPLKPNAKLFEAARSHAANMAKQDKLEHTLDDKTAFDRILATGYKFSRAGENIGWNYQTPKDAVAGWMDSSGHKANILGKEYTQLGVAVAKSAKGERYWVQVFAAPLEQENGRQDSHPGALESEERTPARPMGTHLYLKNDRSTSAGFGLPTVKGWLSPNFFCCPSSRAVRSLTRSAWAG